jgi:hypothetical protein
VPLAFVPPAYPHVWILISEKPDIVKVVVNTASAFARLPVREMVAAFSETAAITDESTATKNLGFFIWIFANEM